MIDELGLVFGALADPTRRLMVERLLRDGSTSVPSLSAELPIMPIQNASSGICLFIDASA